MMVPATILHLNGTSSSGKTTLALTLQEMLSEPFLLTGVDHFRRALPSRTLSVVDRPVDGDPDYWRAQIRDNELIDLTLGPAAIRVLDGMYAAVVAYALVGNPVIIDDVIWDQRILKLAVRRLYQMPVLFIGVRCDLDEAEAREQQRSDRTSGGARLFHERVHSHQLYDLEVDTSRHSTEACANQIISAMSKRSSNPAYLQLAVDFGLL